MFGNAAGWIISVVIVGLYIWVVTLVAGVNTLSPPTQLTQNAANLASFDLTVAPSAVLPMAQAGDAGGLMREAMEIVRQNRRKYEAFQKSTDADDIAGLDALPKLLAAADMSDMTLFADNPSSVISYRSDPEPIRLLRLLGHSASRAGNLLAGSDPKQARKYFEAVFSLGAKLYAERVTWAEGNLGLEMLSSGSGGLASLPAGSITADERAALRNFDAARVELYTEHLEKLWTIIGAIRSTQHPESDLIARHAGDIVALAQKSKDRMIRVESILKLGRYKFDSRRKADTLAVPRLLAELKQSDDPIVRTAADTADALTVEQFRTDVGQ